MTKNSMKRSLLVLASALVLAACAPQTTSSAELTSEATTSEAPAATKITVSATAPVDFDIGDSFDLADYVTIAPKTATFTASSNSSAIEITGTTVKCVAAGTFRITITAGSNKLTKAFPTVGNGSVASKERTALNAYVADLTNNYEAVAATSSGTLTFAYHNPNYYMAPHFPSKAASGTTSSEESTTSDGYRGLVKAGSGDCYEYSLVGSESAGYNLKVNPGKQIDLSKTVLGTNFPLTSGSFSDVFKTNGDFDGIQVASDSLTNLARYTTGYSLSVYEQMLGVSIGSAFVELEDGTTANPYLNIVFATKTGTAAFYIQIGLKNKVTNADLENYIASKAVPTPLSATASDPIITDIVANTKAYTMTSTTSYGYYDNNNAWKAASTSEKAALKKSWVFGEENSTTYVNGTDYYSIDQDKAISAFTKHENTLYYVAGTPATDNSGTTTYTYKASATKLTSIWKKGIASSTTSGGETISAFTPLTLIDLDADALKAINYTDITTNSDGSITESLNAYGDTGAFYKEIMGLQPNNGFTLNYEMTTLYSKSDMSIKWYEFFDFCTISVAADSKSFTFELYLSNLDDAGNGVSFKEVFSDLGTDKVPTDYLKNVDFTTSSASN